MKKSTSKTKSTQRKPHKRGVTLVEVAIGLTISTLIGSVSYNKLLKQRPDLMVNQVTTDLVSELRLARAQAISENARAVVSISDTGITTEVDSDGDGAITNVERRHTGFSYKEVNIARSQTTQVAFTGSGRFVQNNAAGDLSTETITVSTPDSRKRRVITIYSNGQTKTATL